MKLEQVLRDLDEGGKVKIIETRNYEYTLEITRWNEEIFTAWLEPAIFDSISGDTIAEFLVRARNDYNEDLAALDWEVYRTRAEVERENAELKERIAGLEKAMREGD